MRTCCLLVLSLCCLWPASACAAEYQPDPQSVQRSGQAYRYPQAGWIVLHIEGEPYERGFQHGKLLAPEIAATVRGFAATRNSKAPVEGMKQARTLVNALFQRRFEREFLEEMKGIADGASAAGAKFDGRALDLLDIVAVNVWSELDSLDNALDALPTGLEGVRFPKEAGHEPSKSKPSHCSAFAATGAATRDGKVVFGHITMSDLYEANFYNVWLDVQPAKGHRVLMQTCAGGIQSGTDYYVTDAGLLIAETTIGQTRFDAKGMALASRIRKAAQYADNLDGVVAILAEGNNGLYTNEWLLADTKTNEIALFDLGTHKSKLWRSGKNEWFEGTAGFYWSCNNAKDLDVRLEALASVEERPEVPVFQPTDRDKSWLKLYDQHKGKIDADFGKLALSTAPVAAYHAADAKVATTALAKQLKTWALFGPPTGKTWEPTREERDKYPDIKALVGNPWTILHAGRPAEAEVSAAVDLPSLTKHAETDGRAGDDDPPATTPAWRGTLLPKTDADVWLSTAFAHYERVVALEKSLRKAVPDGELTEVDRDAVALALFPFRTDYELGARAAGDVPLSKIKADVRHDEWFRIASGKGVLLLHALRERMGAETFDDMMVRFGKENAGKPVTTAAFREFVEKASDKDLGTFFGVWLNRTGLPDAVRDRSGPFGVTTFHHELEQTLIVYGTADEATTNREAAEALQEAIRTHGSNLVVPIKADRDVTSEDTKKNHLLLIGRPDSNRVVERMAKALPLTFGRRSFVVHEESYANAGSAVFAAAPNPDNARYSIVVLAGLDAYSTWKMAPRLLESPAAEVVVVPHGGAVRALVGAKKVEEKVAP